MAVCAEGRRALNSTTGLDTECPSFPDSIFSTLTNMRQQHNDALDTNPFRQNGTEMGSKLGNAPFQKHRLAKKSAEVIIEWLCFFIKEKESNQRGKIQTG